MPTERVERLAAEVTALAPMELVLRPLSVFQFVALMQLVLRHPDLPASVRETAQTFVAGAQAYFAACPAVLETIAEGEDPARDVPATEDCEVLGLYHALEPDSRESLLEFLRDVREVDTNVVPFPIVRPATDAEQRAALEAELACRCRTCGHRDVEHGAGGVCAICRLACWS